MGLLVLRKKNLIKPIIDNFNKKGIQVFGPLSADTCFLKILERIMMEYYAYTMIKDSHL